MKQDWDIKEKTFDLQNDSANALLNKLKKEKERLIKEKLLLNSKGLNFNNTDVVPFAIPKNWIWVRLNEVSIIQEGPGIRKFQYQKEGVQFLTVTNILEDAVDLEKSKKYISLKEFKGKYNHFKINKGDIVTACSGGSWGKSAIFNHNDILILNTSTLRLRFFGDLGDNKYLYYLTKADFFKNQIAEQLSGQQPNFGYAHYSIIKIPLPPLSEQKRIVAILDEAFAAIDKAKANTEKNLQNAKELFESYLKNVFANPSEGWEEKTLGEVCNIIGGGTPSKAKSKFYNGDIHWATVRDMKFDIISETEHKITKDAIKNSSTNIIPKNNVVIATRVGLGKACILKYDTAINQDLKGVIPINLSKLSISFLFRWFKNISQTIVNEGTGATVQGVKLPFINSLKIPLPPIKEQNKIIRNIDSLEEETKKLETIYQQKLDDLEELKKSILQKAFAGELTYTNEKAIA